MNYLKEILLLQFFIFASMVYGQSKKTVQILEENEIEYYFIYKAIDYSKNTNDTLFLLTSKLNNVIGSEVIKLKIGKKYEAETRLYSKVRISNDMYVFCKPGGNIIEGDTVSMNSLPILITHAKIICE